MDNPTRTRLERTREHLTPEEAVKLLDASKQPGVSRNPERDYCILLLMFRHGLRVTEICNLKMSDVDVKEKVLHIKRLKSCASGDHPMFNGEPRAIQAWLTERTKMHPHANTLFVSERRKPLSRTMVWVMIRKVAKAAGLADYNIHPHMLRHACGYNLINRGTDVRIVQSFLGHRSIQSTVRYTELAPNRFANLY
jgi:type 1 fimbriae regulatory protein FimB